jgi:hypothetical protein
MRFHFVMLLSFTNIVFFLNFFKLSRPINTVLYLCNLTALLATFALLYMRPFFQYNRAKEVFHFTTHHYVFNLFIILWHVIPVFLFRLRQTLSELFMPDIILGALALWVLYFMLMKQYLYGYYGLSAGQMHAFTAGFFLLYFTLYFLLNR